MATAAVAKATEVRPEQVNARAASYAKRRKRDEDIGFLLDEAHNLRAGAERGEIADGFFAKATELARAA